MIYTNNHTCVTATVPKDLPTGNVTITLVTVKGTYTKDFQILGPAPSGVTPVNFSIITIPPPDFVPAISNEWTCGTFQAELLTIVLFLILSCKTHPEISYVTGVFKYDFNKTKSYNDLNYVEFTNSQYGRNQSGAVLIKIQQSLYTENGIDFIKNGIGRFLYI